MNMSRSQCCAWISTTSRRSTTLLGHPAGDELLIRVAGRLTRYLGDAHLVARLGGDEFAVLINGSGQDAVSAAGRILDAFDSPIVVEGRALTVRPSIGFTFTTAESSQTTVDDLLRQADLAMYAAKREGGGCVRSFVPALQNLYELTRSRVPAVADPPRPVASAAEPALSTGTPRQTPRVVWLALGVVALGIVVYSISTQLRALPGRDVLYDSWLYPGLMLASAGLVAARAWRVAAERWGWFLIAAGMACSAVGDVVYELSVPTGQSPNAADPLYLAFYPLVYGGLVLLTKTRLQRVPHPIRLDALVAGFTLAAAGAALMVGPIAAATSGSLATVVVGLAYPAGDVLLLALAAGMVAIFGWRTERRWGLLVAGFMVMGGRGHDVPVPDGAGILHRGHLDRHVVVGGGPVGSRCQLAAGVRRAVPYDAGLGSLVPALACTVARAGGVDPRQ